ncbi:MAG: CoA ester lyase [Acidobacteria bacterium]|nr:CoA ester lyase [Acidobacteriota bacterium]
MALGPLRSILFVPGTRQDRFAKAMAAGADAVVFDLEDGVAADQKPRARALVAAFLQTPDARTARLVRLNAVGTPEGDEDLALFSTAGGFDAVVLPKVESPAAIERVARAFAASAPPRAVPPIVPLLETPRGVLHAEAVANAQAEVPAILLGAEDLTARLAIPRTLDGEELLFARSQVVLAAASVGADAIDAVFTAIGDLAALRRDCARGRALGFRGKIAIHPSHVPVINEVFSPSAAEVEQARRVIDAFEAARAGGEGVTTLDDEMIERPVVERARRLLQLADRCGVRL